MYVNDNGQVPSHCILKTTYLPSFPRFESAMRLSRVLPCPTYYSSGIVVAPIPWSSKNRNPCWQPKKVLVLPKNRCWHPCPVAGSNLSSFAGDNVLASVRAILDQPPSKRITGSTSQLPSRKIEPIQQYKFSFTEMTNSWLKNTERAPIGAAVDLASPENFQPNILQTCHEPGNHSAPQVHHSRKGISRVCLLPAFLSRLLFVSQKLGCVAQKILPRNVYEQAHRLFSERVSSPVPEMSRHVVLYSSFNKCFAWIAWQSLVACLPERTCNPSHCLACTLQSISTRNATSCFPYWWYW